MLQIKPIVDPWPQCVDPSIYEVPDSIDTTPLPFTGEPGKWPTFDFGNDEAPASSGRAWNYRLVQRRAESDAGAGAGRCHAEPRLARRHVLSRHSSVTPRSVWLVLIGTRAKRTSCRFGAPPIASTIDIIS